MLVLERSSFFLSKYSVPREIFCGIVSAMKPAVSVIIPTHNRRALLERAVRSVSNQTFSDFELIVVDDGSTDGTRTSFKKIVRAYSHTPLQNHPIQIIRQKHRGVSAARNAGIRAARGKFIAFLDSDDEWLPEKLERQVLFFLENPRALICQTEEIWIRNGRRVNSMEKHKKCSGRIFKQCLPLCIVSPSAVMMKKELFEKVGHFDESFPACEDYDLWLRVSARFPIYLIDEPLIVKYGGHADQLSRKTPWLDRYRIRALEKMLRSRALSRIQFRWVLEELERKCRIYGRGCLKHGKKSEGKKILNLPVKICL